MCFVKAKPRQAADPPIPNFQSPQIHGSDVKLVNKLTSNRLRRTSGSAYQGPSIDFQGTAAVTSKSCAPVLAQNPNKLNF